MNRLTCHLLQLLALVLLPLLVHATTSPPSDPLNTDTAALPPFMHTGDTNTLAEETDESELVQEITLAIQKGNFAEAYYLWRPRAEAGNADAQYGIGWMYHNGYGLAINDEEAIAWWQLASRQGHRDATFALGMLYALGEGALRRNMKLAISYYHRAASEGHEDARLLLRTLIIEGDNNARQLMQTLLSEGRQAELSEATSVRRSKANIRKGPGTQYKVLTTLQQGHKLLPLKRQGRWILVGIEGKSYTGWVHDNLIDKSILTRP